MGKVIFITSFKGGAGKTTLSANLTGALTSLGKHVLAIDGDFGMRCLDIVLGLESSTLFDAFDVLTGRCGIQSAVVRSCLGFDFLPAPVNYSGENIDGEKASKLISSLKKKYDYIIIDSSADRTPAYDVFANAADCAIVVSLHQQSSIRAAEKTAFVLAGMGIPDIRLVINQFYFSAAAKAELPRLTQLIMRTSVRLLGVVPYDRSLPADQEKGMIAFSKMTDNKPKYEKAVMNIAKRLTGESVALLDGIYSKRKKEKDLY
ncbi:MAG TPA: AAA family ATPase [Bacillota bacterium]|nr:AAA family ATPase [Bacillota bacterium]